MSGEKHIYIYPKFTLTWRSSWIWRSFSLGTELIPGGGKYHAPLSVGVPQTMVCVLPPEFSQTTACASHAQQGSIICKHHQLFAGDWERLYSPGAQVDGEHHPLTNCPCELFNVCRLLRASSSEKQAKKFPQPPLYSLLKQVSGLTFLAFQPTLPKSAPLCVSALLSGD